MASPNADPAAAESTGSDVSGSIPRASAADLRPQALNEPVRGWTGQDRLPGGDDNLQMFCLF